MPSYPELFFLSGPHFPDRSRLWQECKQPPIEPLRFSKIGASEFVLTWKSPAHQANITLTYTHWATDSLLIVATRTQKPLDFLALTGELSQMVPGLIEEHGHTFEKDTLQVILGRLYQPGSVVDTLSRAEPYGQQAALPNSGLMRPLRLTFVPVQR